MGRKKQRPRRAVAIQAVADEGKVQTPAGDEELKNGEKDSYYFVQVSRGSWESDTHYDVSEIVLSNLCMNADNDGYMLNQESLLDSKYLLRFRLNDVEDSVNRIKLGHWPVLPASSIELQFVMSGVEGDVVMAFGNLDGPDESVSGLVHLISLGFLTLRPVLGTVLREDMQYLRMRVEVLESAFSACKSLLENTRQLWKKSMMNVMAWLRPEVMTSETRYGYTNATCMVIDSSTTEEDDRSAIDKQARFDLAGLYEAIKPSKDDPMLEDDLPGLLPELRPYQRRAAYWMIQREKGNSEWPKGSEENSLSYPLCVPLSLIDSSSRMYYNPFCGNISLHPEYSYSYVPGGILADEMGLGKTVELLACIFANRASSQEVTGILPEVNQEDGSERTNLRRLKQERVECVCGAVSESYKYEGLWVQCDVCDAWQHADCVGYSPEGNKAGSQNNQNSKKHIDGEKDNDITMMDGAYICQMCSELIQATKSPVATAATLIVCPSPILSQWQSEIIRHTKPGSLRVLVYEGMRSLSITDTPILFDVSDLISADVVLTTYDVLKEDLSHDFDRHEGDRRTMRFEKRYPVIPTPLTRIFWWRICLDEAQMVESNAAASTEMALRLNAKHHWCTTGTPIQKKLDDLYGLIKFIKACPFDVFRWWAEVIRTPYQEGDVGAMTFAHNFLKTIMWRTSKAQVAEELQIPPQEERVSWLSLSPIEAHFYQRQHETCVKDAHEVVESMKEDILKSDKSGSKAPGVLSEHLITHLEAAKLFNSLLKLRQACCHPQVGSSGLRALQQSPMTMQEILSALVGKTKIEGEEALRKLVSAINGLAGIAMLKQDYSQAVSLYKEALSFAEENSEDFRLDPLLNIHIQHNLSELLLSSDCTEKFSCPSTINSLGMVEQYHKDGTTSDIVPITPIETATLVYTRRNKQVENQVDQDVHNHDDHRNSTEEDGRPVKRARLCGDTENLINESDNLPKEACKSGIDSSSKPTHNQNYSAECEHLKERFLSTFYSRLSMAQQEFRKIHEQVSYEFSCRKNLHIAWWMEALQKIEQNKDSSNELMKKIKEAVAGTLNTLRVSRVSSCFNSISTLKYFIQTGMDSLEVSRKSLLDRLLDIDRTMENPREADVTRVRSCPTCYQGGDGVLCFHCELDDLFQAYETRLFKLNKGSKGDSLTSAEEALDFQKRRTALNRFYQNLSKDNKKANWGASENEDNEKKRDVKDKVMVSKSPSDLEVVLGIIKSNSKGLLDGEGTTASTKQLLLLEGMRKEYALARSLSTAQAQVLRAYDEIKMATSRLRLKEEVDDDSVDALSLNELDDASIQNSSDKFIAVSLLSRIKGQLRYLKGLASSEPNSQSDDPNETALAESNISSSSPAEKEQNGQTKAHEEACPVCQEKLSTQKMVFQCGHVTCCKCLFAMTERKSAHHGNNWIMCPTCRHHTDFGSIAFADDNRSSSYSSYSLADEKAELSIRVQGSYSTKIEAVVRRILSLTSTDPAAKVLVFSSWKDVLDVLEHAFASNRISFVRMKGGRKANVAINCFKGQEVEKSPNGTPAEPGFVQVMLMLFQHGANGLNLLEAKHVILVEPLLNPAVEAQAIGRVHRIGQENRTFVHRFIVKDTVEESIYKLNRSRNTTSSLVSGNRKNQDFPVLTLKDVESLFRVASSTDTEEEEQQTTQSLAHLPPSVAAAMAAERRLAEGKV